jgi:hypothetical protein
MGTDHDTHEPTEKFTLTDVWLRLAGYLVVWLCAGQVWQSQSGCAISTAEAGMKTFVWSIYDSTHEIPADSWLEPATGHGYLRGGSMAGPSSRSRAGGSTSFDHQLGRNHDQVQRARQRGDSPSTSSMTDAEIEENRL